jgi:Ser/Thr protein kinase RdoA (MazF antagonist)
LSFSTLSHPAQLELLEDLTRTMLSEHYGLDGQAVQLQIQQYEDNAVWRVTPVGNTPFVARLSVRDSRPAHQQRSEMRWLESLAESRTIAVPGPVTTTDGRYVIPVDVPGHDEPSILALLHWVPGTAEPPYREPGMAEQMGVALASLLECRGDALGDLP